MALATIGLVSILAHFTCHKTKKPEPVVRKALHPYRFLEAEMNRRGLEFARDAQVMSVSSDNIELPDDILRARALFIKALPKPPDSIPYDYQYERTERAQEFIYNGQWQQAVDQVIMDIPRDANLLNSAIFCLGSIKLGDLKTARRFAPILPPYNENYANFASHRKDIDDQNDRSTFDSNLPSKFHSKRELEALCWFILAFEFPEQYPLSNSKSELYSARNAVQLAPNIAGYRYLYAQILYKQ